MKILGRIIRGKLPAFIFLRSRQQSGRQVSANLKSSYYPFSGLEVAADGCLGDMQALCDFALAKAEHDKTQNPLVQRLKPNARGLQQVSSLDLPGDRVIDLCPTGHIQGVFGLMAEVNAHRLPARGINAPAFEEDATQQSTTISEAPLARLPPTSCFAETWPCTLQEEQAGALKQIVLGLGVVRLVPEGSCQSSEKRAVSRHGTSPDGGFWRASVGVQEFTIRRRYPRAALRPAGKAEKAHDPL
jgi:hypothetical protein